jgi:hypothetical protein
MEASYAHTQQVTMVPMMMEDGYKASGWLGMLLGTRLWCKFVQTSARTAVGQLLLPPPLLR